MRRFRVPCPWKDACRASFWEEALEFLGIWLTLVAMLGHMSDAIPSQAICPCSLALCQCILDLCLFLTQLCSALVSVNSWPAPADVQFKSGVTLHGYRIEATSRALHLQLFLLPDHATTSVQGVRMGFSVHMIDQESGVSFASSDEFADRKIPGFSARLFAIYSVDSLEVLNPAADSGPTDAFGLC